MNWEQVSAPTRPARPGTLLLEGTSATVAWLTSNKRDGGSAGVC
jgi:hypothetical protein